MRFAEPHLLPQDDGYLSVDCGDFRVTGRSLAGVETVFSVPQLNVTFDTGRAPGFAYARDILALTHFHLDHAGGLPFYLGLRCLNGLKPLKIVMPAEKIGDASRYLESLLKVSESDLRYELIPASVSVALKKNFTLSARPSFHCVPSTGYVVNETRKRLKREYVGLSGDEIRDLKARGVDIDDEAVIPILAFSGDSTAEFLAGDVLRARVLLMECTFFGDDDDYEKIRAYGHTHIRDWVELAERIESDIVVMTHTSLRHSREEVAAVCRNKLPESLLRRLVIFR